MQELGGITADLDIRPGKECVNGLQNRGSAAGREPGEVTLAAEHLQLLAKSQCRQRRVESRARRGAQEQADRSPILRRRGQQLQAADVQVTSRDRQRVRGRGISKDVPQRLGVSSPPGSR